MNDESSVNQPQDTVSTNEWAGNRAARWVQMWDRLERQLSPASEILFEAAQLTAGQRVLDVGCGTGPTTRFAATLVGSTGAVTGVDISPDMLNAARAVEPDPSGASIGWIQADLEQWGPKAAEFDAVISRFGVMFFARPEVAFANLCGLVSAGGSLNMVTWADRRQSPLFELPLQVTLDYLGNGHDIEVLPPTGGPFSFGDLSLVTAVLEPAGWREVSASPRPMPLHVGGGLNPKEAAQMSLEFGPTRIIAENLDDQSRNQLAAALASEYQNHVDAQGLVVLDATPVLITAHK